MYIHSVEIKIKCPPKWRPRHASASLHIHDLHERSRARDVQRKHRARSEVEGGQASGLCVYE